jgi:hypothetical protein
LAKFPAYFPEQQPKAVQLFALDMIRIFKSAAEKALTIRL